MIRLRRQWTCWRRINRNFVSRSRDGIPEITGVTAASANIDNPDLYDYDDHNAWFMSFNLNLELVNDPIIFPDDFSRFFPANQISSPTYQITGLFHNTGMHLHRPFIFQTEDYSKIERKVFLPDGEVYSGINIVNLRMGGDSILVAVSAKAGLFFYNDSLELIKHLRFGRDIDSDNPPVRSVFSQEDMMVIKTSPGKER